MAQPKDYTQRPSVPGDTLVLYVRKAIPAPTANSLKPLMICEALSIPYSIHLIKSLPEESWYHEINPFKQLPAIEDVEVYENGAGEKRRLNVFDSTAIFIYLCEKYDKEGEFIGKNNIERAQIMNWLIAYTAGLGATGEWWLKLRNDPELAPALRVIETSIQKEYAILEKRLNEPGQEFIALPGRPTLADFAIQPLANPRVAKNAKLNFADWPKLKAWSEKIDNLPYIARAMEKNNVLGMTEEEIKQHGR